MYRYKDICMCTCIFCIEVCVIHVCTHVWVCIKHVWVCLCIHMYVCLCKEPICFLIHISQKATESQRGQATCPVSHSLCDDWRQYLNPVIQPQSTHSLYPLNPKHPDFALGNVLPECKWFQARKQRCQIKLLKPCSAQRKEHGQSRSTPGPGAPPLPLGESRITLSR